MILLITDCQTCTLLSLLRKMDHKVAFLELHDSQFSPAFNTVLGNDSLEFAVIECFMNIHRCLELLNDIKRQRPDVPVIFVVSPGSDHAVTKTLSSGARYCFTKPLDEIRFNERVRMLLELKRVSRERRAPLLSVDPKSGEDACIAADMPENILRTMHFIEDHLSRHDLSIERLARIACVSPFHFCRIFKKHTNKSPMQFVNHVRIEKAKEFLSSCSESMPVSLIANTVGFYDSSQLNKHFKKATGLTPSAFKQKVKPALAK